MARAATTEYVTVRRIAEGDTFHEAVIHMRGKVWHARYTLDGGKTYVRETTEKRERAAAEAVAHDRLAEMRGVKKHLGFIPRKTTFARVSAEALAEFERTHAETGNPSIHMLKQWRVRINGLALYFGDRQPATITRKDWNKYIEHRISTGKARDAKVSLPSARQIKRAKKQQLPELDSSTAERKPISRSTLMHERMAMRAVMQKALEDGLITFIPELKLPRKESSDKHSARPTFTPSEINRLFAHLSARLSIKN